MSHDNKDLGKPEYAYKLKPLRIKLGIKNCREVNKSSFFSTGGGTIQHFGFSNRFARIKHIYFFGWWFLTFLWDEQKKVNL